MPIFCILFLHSSSNIQLHFTEKLSSKGTPVHVPTHNKNAVYGFNYPLRNLEATFEVMLEDVKCVNS